jgi:hypothetical protein
MIYQLQTDGDILIKAFEDMYMIRVFVRQHGLTRYDYAIIEGNLLKSFDTQI